LLIGLGEIVDKLREVATATGSAVTEEALQLIGEEAAGGLRDALSLFEQVTVFADGEVGTDDVLTVLGAVNRDVFYDLTAALLRGDLQAALLLIKDVVLSGRDLHHFTQQAITYYRDLMVALACGGDTSVLGITPEWATRLRQQAEALGMRAIGGVLAELHRLLTQIRWSARPRLLWELALFRIFAGDTVMENAELLQKIDNLEKRLAAIEQGGTKAVTTDAAVPVRIPAVEDAVPAAITHRRCSHCGRV
jgi:DNA polymerase III subunit gamma/tau